MTSEELINCLEGRPCSVCKFHGETGCQKWKCVFEQPTAPEGKVYCTNHLLLDEKHLMFSFDSTGEYIKKSDLMAKVVTETLSDYTEDDVVYADVINSLPTYSFPKRSKGEWIEKEGKEKGYDIGGVKTWYVQIMCNKCGFIKTAIEGHASQYNFCPNCGADMRGGE